MSEYKDRLAAVQELNLQTQLLRAKITAAFTELIEDAEVAQDIAFHITDWDHDLADLVRLYQQPEQVSDDEVVKIILGFLIHVPNHIAAAKKLAGCGPIEDTFKVGVLEEDSE